MFRRTVYAGSLLAAGALLNELAFWALTRTHGVDRGIRVLDRIRDAARF